MVRNYIRKTNRAVIDDNVIVAAINDLINGNYKSIREAALATGISKSTLHFRIKKIKIQDTLQKPNIELKDNTDEDKPGPLQEVTTDCFKSEFSSRFSHKQVFTTTQEELLVEYIISRSEMNYGLTFKQTRELAFKYSIGLHLHNRIPQTWVSNGIAGEEWMKMFMKRHPNLSLRQPENTSLSRNTSFNKHNLNLFHDNLEKLLTKTGVTASCILNLDESGVSTVLKAPKVIAAVGIKQVGQAVSGERGEQVTFCGIIKADGEALPPAYVFPRKRYNPALTDDAPEGSLPLFTESGWMNSELFLEVIKHIQKHTNCTKEKPIILLLDNHESHASLNVVIFCRDNGIHLLTFPPHTTHRLQPLDIAVFGPFKQKCRESFNNWLAKHPGRTISIREIGKLTTEPFVTAFRNKNIKAGFKKPGIWPFNRLAFGDLDFKGSRVTDRPNLLHDGMDGFNSQKEVGGIEHSEDVSAFQYPNMESLCNAGPSSSTINLQSTLTPCSMVSRKSEHQLTPQDVLPYPTCGPRKESNNKRKKGCSRILTDSLEKKAIEDKHNERELKKRKLWEKKCAIKTAKAKNKKTVEAEDSSDSIVDQMSDESGLSPLDLDEDDDDAFEFLTDRSFRINDFVLVRFLTKKTTKYYIAQVDSLDLTNMGVVTLKYMRRKEDTMKFFFPEKEEKYEIETEEIIYKLRQPSIIGGTARATNCFIFKEDLRSYKPS